LHCAASCNNLAMVKFLVEHGACIFAATLSDQETAAEKCEEDEEGFDGCSEYLYSKEDNSFALLVAVIGFSLQRGFFYFDFSRHPGEAGHFERRSSVGRLRLRGAEYGRVDFPDGRRARRVAEGRRLRTRMVVVPSQRSRGLRASQFTRGKSTFCLTIFFDRHKNENRPFSFF